jgi:hypothetical protein
MDFMLTNRLIKIALNAVKSEFIPLDGKEFCREEGHVKMKENIYAKEDCIWCLPLPDKRTLSWD